MLWLKQKNTYVLTALLHHLDGDIHKNIIMETKKGCLSVSEIAEQLRSEIRKCLPFAHAVSECDTVSSTYGPGKLRAYKKLNELNS